MTVIVPIHPRTRKIIERNKIKIYFTMIDPIGYFEMIELLKNCKLVLTDSGGMQKEAYFFNKYCVTLRDETEWVELIQHGFNKLAGANEQNIIDAFNSFTSKPFRKTIDLYGGGNASVIIRKTLESIIS